MSETIAQAYDRYWKYGYQAGADAAFAIIALGVWAREAWEGRMRRIFRHDRGSWYCIECGARQDFDPVKWPGVWHLEKCPLGPDGSGQHKSVAEGDKHGS